MFSFEVKGKEYTIKYGYGVLRKTDLIDRVVNLGNTKVEDGHAFQNMISTVSELLLCGLQKYHKDEFGYTGDKGKAVALEKVDELMDAYDEEGTEENPQNCYTLFEKLQEELMANGFLLGTQKKAQEIESQQDNVVPLAKD